MAELKREINVRASQGASPVLEALCRRIATRHLKAAGDGSTIANPIRQKVNSDLIRAGMDGNRRFRNAGEALSVIAGVLGKYAIEWDEVLNGFRFGQEKGRASIDLAFQTDDPFTPVSIRNTALAFHWDTLESGVEVVAYLG